MIVQRELSAWQNESAALSAAVGFFDGVHLGHAKVISEAIADAKAQGGNAWVLTFDPHPLKIVKPAIAPRLITGLSQKQRLLEGLGVKGCMVLPFTAELAATLPEAFARLVACNAPHASSFFVGENWRFGKDRAGDSEMFSQLADAQGCRVTIMTSVCDQELAISSTRVRAAIEAGDLDSVSGMLGRCYSIEGCVVPGSGRGRELGYPTANIATESEALPPFGIYAVFARIGDEVHDAVLSFGTRPTFEPDSNAAPVIEVHIIDHREDLYGKHMEVFFLTRIREERAFDTVDALIAEIARDVSAAAAFLKKQEKRKDSLYIQTRAII